MHGDLKYDLTKLGKTLSIAVMSYVSAVSVR